MRARESLKQAFTACGRRCFRVHASFRCIQIYICEAAASNNARSHVRILALRLISHHSLNSRKKKMKLNKKNWEKKIYKPKQKRNSLLFLCAQSTCIEIWLWQSAASLFLRSQFFVTSRYLFRMWGVGDVGFVKRYLYAYISNWHWLLRHKIQYNSLTRCGNSWKAISVASEQSQRSIL